jgi:hypothetical protein
MALAGVISLIRSEISEIYQRRAALFLRDWHIVPSAFSIRETF